MGEFHQTLARAMLKHLMKKPIAARGETKSVSDQVRELRRGQGQIYLMRVG